MEGKIISISYTTAKEFLLPRHYSGRTPSISYAFGWEINKRMVAVCTFGKPASPSLCKGVCGDEFSSRVYELNRLCRIKSCSKQLSQFVSACLRRLKPHNLIIVSYSDTAMNHHGYIYQACNFLYTGVTKKRTDKFTEGNKHSRHYDGGQNGLRKIRSPKHRYVYFAMKNRHLKKKTKQCLRYAVCEYPKGINSNYTLGEYLNPIVIKCESKRLRLRLNQ